MSNAVIEINTTQLIHNLQTIRSHLYNSNDQIKFCFPVKGNAYGHGLVKIALLAEPYIDYIAVSCLDEGVTLRNHGVSKPILVFGSFNDEDVPGLIAHNLEITVASEYKAQVLSKFCQQNQHKCRVHIKVDTGMNRVGVRVDTARQLIEFVMSHQELEPVGVYSHLSSSDEIDRSVTDGQIAQFTKLATYVKSINPNIICHLANSGGICYYSDSYFDMVRPGILCYGYPPQLIPKTCHSSASWNPSQDWFNTIKPCFSLKSKVTFFKSVDRNQGISYNHSYITTKPTRIVTIPVGYGDGYRRILSNTGNVLIHGNKYTIAGTICMDMFMVDIGKDGEAYVGDEVVLIGRQGPAEILIEDLAQKCQTNIYEILCGFTDRIPRVYV